MYILISIISQISVSYADIEKASKAFDEEDYETAYQEYSNEAHKGNIDAQRMLGYILETGKNGFTDKSRANEWYEKAGKQGDAYSQYRAAGWYLEGHRYDEALKWLKMAVEQDYAPAFINYGYLYQKGNGVRQNYYEAMKWYQKAADKGDADGQYNVGLFHYSGYTSNASYKKAKEWWIKAARQGHATAYTNIGVLFEHGQGVERNIALAYIWYNQAAKKGDETAKRNLSLFHLSDMSRNQVLQLREFSNKLNDFDDLLQFSRKNSNF